MRTTFRILLFPLFLFPILLSAQSDNTVYVKNFSGATLGQMIAAAQATCSTTLTCVVVLDPSLASVPQGTLPAQCATCIWEDFRVPASLSITGNLYVNGIQVGPPASNGESGGTSGSGTNGTLAAPAFSPGSGTYSGTQSVTIGLPAGATGCYTEDGSTPVAASGTCSSGYTYSAPIAVTGNETINVLATESGWTNSAVTTGIYTIDQTGLSTYSDNFMRSSGGLGANWSVPYQGDASLQIVSDLIYSAAPGPTVTHSLEVYSGGTFSNNQYSIITLASGIGSNSPGQASQFAVVRGSTSAGSGDGFYNDGVATGSNFGGLVALRVGNSTSVDFCPVGEQALTDYSIGDTHELDVAGTGPVFFWSKHNGVVDSTCYTSEYAFSGGSPGLGVVDRASTPQVALGAWQGGSLPNFNTTPTDNFQRANAGWLGVNWWMDEFGMHGGYLILNNNAAVMNSTTSGQATALALWTTPFNLNHSSTITIGSLAGNDWLAAMVRCTLPPEPMNPGSEKFYIALDVAGTIDLFAYSNGWNLLSSLGNYSGTVKTIELDATGSSPVSLAVKINGAQFGSTFSDSTYKLAGTYAGFAAAATSSSSVTGWAGANL
jgi:hypothetical protein